MRAEGSTQDDGDVRRRADEKRTQAMLVASLVILLVINVSIAAALYLHDDQPLRSPNDGMSALEGVDISYYYDSRPIDLVGELGLSEERAAELANGTLTMRVALLETGGTVDFAYNVTPREAWIDRFAPAGLPALHLDDPDVGRPYHLSFHLVVGSNDPWLRNATLWGRGNYLNVTFRLDEWWSLNLTLEPGFEGFDGLILNQSGMQEVCVTRWTWTPQEGWTGGHGFVIHARIKVTM